MRILNKVILFIVIVSTGYSQGSLNFDGVNDFVQTSYAGVLGSSPRSIEAWIRTTSPQLTIVDYGEFNSPNGRRFTLTVTNTGLLRVEVRGWGVNGTTILTDNLWHHVAVTYNGTNFKLYVDGILEATGTSSVTVNTTSSTSLPPGVRIGNRSNINSTYVNYFSGDIDEVRFWDFELSNTDITLNMNTEIPGSTSGLTGYWKMNETTGTVATDDSNGGNNGILFNFALDGSGKSDWNPNSALPVDLIHFSAEYDQKAVLLSWTTDTEINNMGFDIERSSDGRRFEKIGYQAGHGTSYQTNRYSHIDKTPKQGANLYRLVQKDYDGHMTYSKIEIAYVNITEVDDIFVYPNPVGETLHIQSFDENSTAILYSNLGQPLHTLKSGSTLIAVDMTKYPRGQYVLVVQSGNKTFEKLIVKY